MTPEAQQIAIATHCGWKPLQEFPGRLWPHQFLPSFMMPPNESTMGTSVPAYLSDLNIMAKAESLLSHDQRRDYASALINICGTFGCIFASAAQRAEAFLRTLNLWTE